MKKIDILDKGYVRFIPKQDSDLTVVNSARVSYDKESFELSEKDIKLINFLAREGHLSPFRHAMLTFEVNAPLMIARQWFKYIVGSDHTMQGWNESSRRYITESCEFYIPEQDSWRSKPANSKQGSGVPINETQGLELTNKLLEYVEKGEELYELAMAYDVAPEQARLFLPSYGMYVRWYWTASLDSVAHLINERTAEDSQHEFRLYAEAVKQLASEDFPVSIDALTNKE